MVDAHQCVTQSGIEIQLSVQLDTCTIYWNLSPCYFFKVFTHLDSTKLASYIQLSLSNYWIKERLCNGVGRWLLK